MDPNLAAILARAKCRTCRGTVILSSRYAEGSAHIEVTAACHGMWGMFLLPRKDLEQGELRGIKRWIMDVAAKMPEKIPEYDVSEDFPRVRGRVRFEGVRRALAINARLGAEMQIAGKRGTVVGIGKRNPYFVELAP